MGFSGGVDGRKGIVCLEFSCGRWQGKDDNVCGEDRVARFVVGREDVLVVPWYVLLFAFEGDVLREVDVDVDVLRDDDAEFTRLGTSEKPESFRGILTAWIWGDWRM